MALKTKNLTGQLKGMIYAHHKWLEGDPSSVCADLRGMDLAHLDFRGCNLSQANLSRANLEGANLSKVNFTAANLSAANLHTATIRGANFTNAVLARAFAAYVSFEKVNLVGTDLTNCDLSGALNMNSVIWGDDPNSRLQMARFRIVPDGEFIGWKKLRGGKVAKLLIPMEAKRSNGFNRRCRAEFVKVLSIIDENDQFSPEGYSRRTTDLLYKVGEICRPDGWDEDWKNECSHGINFFLTQEEAEAY